MPRIHSIEIRNFRGIEHLEQTFNPNSLAVLIGRCDSGKSTVLNAIFLALCPYWNPQISTTDFYKEDTSKEVTIVITISDVPEDLLKDSKYGLYHRVIVDGVVSDDVENHPDSEPVLTVKFSVDGDMVPKWTVINGRGDNEIELKASDRAKFRVFMISDCDDNHFTLSKSSPLFSLLKESNNNGLPINKSLSAINKGINEAIKNEELTEFSDSIKGIEIEATKLGFDIKDIKVLLELKESLYNQSSLSLHDNEGMPFHLHGKGAKRLLSIAIQMALVKNGAIVLIDELEQGLEPDRIINITRCLKDVSSGQTFVTTHSGEVITEANYDNIYVLRKDVNSMFSFEKEWEAIIRLAPWAFFAKRLICCEGRTEFGVIRAIDTHIRNTTSRSLSSLGISYLDCKGGDNSVSIANHLRRAGYDVCIIMDNDVPAVCDKANKESLTVFTWEKGFCIEQQLAKDLPWTSIERMINDLLDDRGSLSINGTLIRNIADIASFDANQKSDFRLQFGNSAKNNDKNKRNYYKSIPGGEYLGELWIGSQSELDPQSTLCQIFNSLVEWIKA